MTLIVISALSIIDKALGLPLPMNVCCSHCVCSKWS